MAHDHAWGSRTLGALLSARAEETPDRVFVWWDGRSTSYGAMAERSALVAAGLSRIGVSRGEHVALLMDNGLEYLECMFGLAHLGAVQVPLNPAYKAWQLSDYLTEMDITVLVAEARHLGELVTSLPGGIRHVVVVDGPAQAIEPSVPMTAFEDLVVGVQSGASTVDVRPSDPCVIMATSGTTSASKGVLLAHAHEYQLARNFIEALDLEAGDVFYNYFPLFHNTAQGIITWGVLAAGASMVLIPKFSKTAFWDDVQKHGCTHFFAMGPIVEFLLSDERSLDVGRSSSLAVGWGIGFSADQAAEFEERFGVRLFTGYGLTEGSIVSFSPRSDPRLETVGRPHRDFVVSIVDDDDRPLPMGHVGEIVIRPKKPYITFLGYYNRPDETIRCWRNLWLHTGDAGKLDEDGYLHFVDRQKDVIRRRGENISSFEVEWVVQQFPGVIQCAAVGVESEHGSHDQEVYVAIVADGPLDWGHLIRHCEELLAYFAVPRYFEMWDELPTTPTAKVRKAEIRERGVVADAVWDRRRDGGEGQ